MADGKMTRKAQLDSRQLPSLEAIKSLQQSGKRLRQYSTLLTPVATVLCKWMSSKLLQRKLRLNTRNIVGKNGEHHDDAKGKNTQKNDHLMIPINVTNESMTHLISF